MTNPRTPPMHSTLADRIEAATGHSRELDVAIFRIVKPEYASEDFQLYGTGMRHKCDSSDARSMPELAATVPAYTASIDAALTLVPDQHLAGVLYHAQRRIQETGFPNSTYLHRLICEILIQALRAKETSHGQ